MEHSAVFATLGGNETVRDCSDEGEALKERRITMLLIPDAPDISCALETGYAPWEQPEEDEDGL